MFNYQYRFAGYSDGGWSGVCLPTPFYSNTYMPFNEADNLEISNVALNHLLIQREDVSIFSTPGNTVRIQRTPTNISSQTIASRNEFTEFNGDMNGNAEGGDLSFGGEAIESVVLRRSSSRSKFHIWEDIAIIPITSTSIYTLNKIIYDPYVEHGITYQYAIQPVGGNGRGAQYETPRNQSVFDDIWLIGSDTKQLMMGYNPVVSNYKYVVKDTAIETIGSKYPYVVRNANVGYTQFSFSCTITAHMNIINDKEVFTPFKDIEVLDEYKDIIVGDTGGSTTGGGDITERPEPGGKITVSLKPNYIIRTNEKVEDSTNKVVVSKQGEIKDIEVLEKDLPGNTLKVAFPISVIEAAGQLNLREEAIKLGTVKLYDEYISDKEIIIWVEDPENPGQVLPQKEIVPGHTTVPLFVSANDVVEGSMVVGPKSDQPNGVSEESEVVTKLRRDSFSLTKEELDEKIMAIKKYEYSRAFDPAYPSSPTTEKGIDSDLTVVDSDREYMLEREFRNRVIDFVYDGRPKIFKSPTEGLMLVKLTDISLTPNTTLGRMIHDFSCTCTEIGKVNPETLAKYGFRDARGDVPVLSSKNEIETEMGVEEAAKLYELFRN